MTETYWIETLGCPKNEVDSEKLAGTLHQEGMILADSVNEADLVVVNTCAFIEDAQKESIETVLAINDIRHSKSELVVTGCMAERYGRAVQLHQDAHARSRGTRPPHKLSCNAFDPWHASRRSRYLRMNATARAR